MVQIKPYPEAMALLAATGWTEEEGCLRLAPELDAELLIELVNQQAAQAAQARGARRE